MNFRSQIPNLFTMANLVCGSVAVIYVSQYSYFTSAIFLIFLAAFFDLLDGAIARALNVSGEMGKQLDSLADVVSFGLAPTIVVYKLLEENLPENLWFLKFASFINVSCAAYRLAKFNLSKDQTHDFSGMPSPANGIFWASVMAIYAWSNAGGDSYMPMLPNWLLLMLLLITSLLMISHVRMFSFKFKPGGFRSNMYPIVFLILIALITSICTLIVGNFLLSIPVSIVAYMMLSLLYHQQKAFQQ